MGRKRRGGNGKGNRVGEASEAGPGLAPAPVSEPMLPPMPRLDPEPVSESVLPPMPGLAPKPVSDYVIPPRPRLRLAPMPAPARVSSCWPVYVYEPKPGSESGSGCGSGSKVEVDYSGIEFVMRGVRFARDGIGHNGMWFDRDEYFRVYVENDEFVAKPLCESQLSSQILFPCFMHRCGSRIYNISTFLMVDGNLIPDSIPLDGETIHCHSGISWFDLNDETSPKKWHSSSSLELYKTPGVFAVLNNKIYFLRPQYTERPFKVRRITLDSCEVYQHQFPYDTSDFQVNGKMIPHPSNNYILVHLPLGLFAWHPTCKRWYHITSDIDDTAWINGSPILVNDVLYFYTDRYPPYFSAYDLIYRKWLTVKWPTRFPPDAARVHTDTMFYLGNGLVCLPASRRIFTQDKFPNPQVCEWGACVQFSVFHFHRTSTPVDGPDVIFTHLFTKTVDVEHLVDIVDFLFLV